MITFLKNLAMAVVIDSNIVQLGVILMIILGFAMTMILLAKERFEMAKCKKRNEPLFHRHLLMNSRWSYWSCYLVGSLQALAALTLFAAFAGAICLRSI